MNRGIPKYLQISKEIIERIQSGEFQPGDKIPSENEIIKMYSVSNTTARKSLHEVELQGWANRIKGKGTFVLNRFEDRHLTRMLGNFHAIRDNFDDNLRREGFKPRITLLEKTIVEEGASINVNNRQFVIKGPALKIHRLRYADDVLLKDETKFISLLQCPKIHLLDLDKVSLISTYEKSYSQKLKHASRTIGAAILHPDDPNNYFENTSAIPVFQLFGAILNTHDELVELEQSYYHGEKYKFTVMAIPEFKDH